MQLPVVELSRPARGEKASTARRARRRWSDLGWHGVRLVLMLGLVTGLHRWSTHRPDQYRPGQHRLEATGQLSLEQVHRLLPTATELRNKGHGRWEALDSQATPLGILATTLPETQQVIGYSGPSNVLICLTPEQTIQCVQLLSSGDTAEHVALVEADPQFWQQFNGLAWGNTALNEIDGVSGATLTSLAIAESIALRISGQRQSLRFPDPVELQEVQTLVPEAASLSAGQWNGHAAWDVRDANHQSLGQVVRTGNLVDAIEGYQGPSELLFWLDAEGVLLAARVRHSYDNQPYVGYIRQEYSFWPLFTHRSLDDLAKLDLEAEGVEGVSGATMTSMAVAATVVAAAARLTDEAPSETASKIRPAKWNWSTAELATGLLALLSLPWSRSHLRGRPRIRWMWQVMCLLVLGWWTSNLLSLALMAGWTRGGMPFHLAPGLSLLLLVSLAAPAFTKQNVYCDQLCPHGIVQQWLRPFRRQRMWPAARPMGLGWVRFLQLTRGLCLVAAAGWLLGGWPIALAWLEPFDSYAWRIGLSVSLAVGLFSLLAAWWRPMAYCQLACPTGRLLESVRHRRRHRNSWRFDGLLALTTAAVWGWQWYHAW